MAKYVTYTLIEYRLNKTAHRNTKEEEHVLDVFSTDNPQEFNKFVRENGCNTHVDNVDYGHRTWSECSYEIIRDVECDEDNCDCRKCNKKCCEADPEPGWNQCDTSNFGIDYFSEVKEAFEIINAEEPPQFRAYIQLWRNGKTLNLVSRPLECFEQALYYIERIDEAVDDYNDPLEVENEIWVSADDIVINDNYDEYGFTEFDLDSLDKITNQIITQFQNA